MDGVCRLDSTSVISVTELPYEVILFTDEKIDSANLSNMSKVTQDVIALDLEYKDV